MSDISKMTTRVSGHSESATRMTVRSGPFSMIIDEPESFGGSNQGPSPMQALLMSLAGCLNVTAHEVARQQGLDLRSLDIDIQGELNPAKFMGVETDERAGFQDIELRLNPDFAEIDDEKYQKWAQETEKRCPVTDTIKLGTRLRVMAAA